MIEQQSLESYSSPDRHGAPDVLVVEDDPEINELIGAYVEMSGFPCRRVMRGDDALREVREHRPALIILDVMLPDLDGFEICRRIRADAATAAIPIIILTALDQELMRCRAIECGATDYLTKPFDPDRLMAAIRRRAGSGEPVAAHSIDQR
jgi:DNA-binding response OmpR family regulator